MSDAKIPETIISELLDVVAGAGEEGTSLSLNTGSFDYNGQKLPSIEVTTKPMTGEEFIQFSGILLQIAEQHMSGRNDDLANATEILRQAHAGHKEGSEALALFKLTLSNYYEAHHLINQFNRQVEEHEQHSTLDEGIKTLAEASSQPLPNLSPKTSSRSV